MMNSMKRNSKIYYVHKKIKKNTNSLESIPGFPGFGIPWLPQLVIATAVATAVTV